MKRLALALILLATLVALTPEPGQPRTDEVIVAQEMLQSMGLRAFSPMVTACPGCGRTTSTFFQTLAQDVQNHVRERMPEWKLRYPGVESLSLAVMGCVVNGPGESKHANIGISLPGTGEKPVAPVYEDGQKTRTLKGDGIAAEFQALGKECGCQRVIRRCGTECRDTLCTFVDCSLQQVLELAKLVAAVIRTRQVVVRDADLTYTRSGRDTSLGYRCRQVRQRYLAKLSR